jgi:DNA-binding XRE family transcriptional regulator
LPEKIFRPLDRTCVRTYVATLMTEEDLEAYEGTAADLESAGATETAAELRALVAEVRRLSGPMVDTASPTPLRRQTLREMRAAAGKSQIEFARLIESNQGELSKLEHRADPQLATLRKYARALGRELEVVFVAPDGDRVAMAEPKGEIR